MFVAIVTQQQTRDEGEENRMEKSLSFELFPVSKSIRRFSLSLMLPKCERFLHRDKQTYEQNAILNHSDEKYSHRRERGVDQVAKLSFRHEKILRILALIITKKNNLQEFL